MLPLWPTFSVGPLPTYQTNFKFNIKVSSEAEGIADHVTLLRLFLFSFSFFSFSLLVFLLSLLFWQRPIGDDVLWYNHIPGILARAS